MVEKKLYAIELPDPSNDNVPSNRYAVIYTEGKYFEPDYKRTELFRDLHKSEVEELIPDLRKKYGCQFTDFRSLIRN